MIDFNLDFYNIHECGFYRKGERAPEFGNLNTLLIDYEGWIANKAIRATKTYDTGRYKNKLPVYCKDYFRDADTQDVILVTWNETMHDDGTVYSISGQSQVGDTAVASTEVPDGNIPGYATYFWFIPEMDIFCCLRPESAPLNGQDNLKAYFKNFLDISPSFIITDADGMIAGHTDDHVFGAKPVIAKFDTRVKTRDTQVEALRNGVNDITKVVTTNHLTVNDEIKRGLMRSILDSIYLPDRNENLLLDKSYRLDFQYSPTLEDLDRIIYGWNQVNDDSDIGFVFTGKNGTPVWLSHTYEKHEISLDLQRDPGSIIDAQELMDRLLRRRTDLLNLLD